MKSPLKWVGSKGWVLSHLNLAALKSITEGRVIYEPFAGSAAISLGLDARWVWLNDRLFPLMNFYRVLQELWRCGDTVALDWMTGPLPSTAEEYYKVRDEYNKRLLSASRELKGLARVSLPLAHYFYILNRTGYYGLYRSNQNGELNTPYGHYKSPRSSDLKGLAARLDNFVLTSHDYAETSPGDHFLVVDPPHWGRFNGYTTDPPSGTVEEATWQKNLADWVQSQQGPALVFNAPSAEKLYRKMGWTTTGLVMADRLSCPSGNGKSRTEIVAAKGFKIERVLK